MVSEILDIVIDIVSDMLDIVFDMVSDMLDIVIDMVSEMLDIVIDMVSDMLDIVFDMVSDMLDIVIDIVSDILDIVFQTGVEVEVHESFFLHESFSSFDTIFFNSGFACGVGVALFGTRPGITGEFLGIIFQTG